MNVMTKLKKAYCNAAGTKAGKFVLALLSFVPMFMTAAVILYYIWGPAEGYFHSDCTDNLLWANASIESGKVFDSSFTYGGLFPFSTNIWMIPLIKIFGFGMTAQNIAMSILALLFMVSAYFFFRCAAYGKAGSSIAVSVIMLFMSSSDKLRELMYGHTIYYSMATMILMALAGFIFLALKGEEKDKPGLTFFCSMAIVLLCIGTAVDGGQVIVIGSLPVIIAVVAERFLDFDRKLFSKENATVLRFVLCAGSGTAFGLMLLDFWKNNDISSSYVSAYSGWSDMSIWSSNALTFIRHFLSTIGVSATTESLFSRESLAPMIRIAAGCVILIVPVIMTVLYKKIKGRTTRIMLLAHWFSTAVIMFGFICGKLSYASWRVMPIVATCAIVTVMGTGECLTAAVKKLKSSAEETEKAAIPENANAENGVPSLQDDTASDSCVENEKTREIRSGRILLRFGSIVLAVLLVFSLLVFTEIAKMPSDYGRDNQLHLLVNFLVEKNLKYGYATFWNSQSITALSDSITKCRNVSVSETEGIIAAYYQSSSNWYVNQDYENFYVLLSDSEYEKVLNSNNWGVFIDKYLQKEYSPADGVCSGFHIFVFSINILDSNCYR